MGIRLSLKGDTIVSLLVVKGQRQSDQPLYDIPQIEEHKQHLLLLLKVDSFMIQRHIAYALSISHKEPLTQQQCRKSLERNNVVIDDA